MNCIWEINQTMSKDEFKDRLFDALNETDSIPIKDIKADDRNNNFEVCLDDDTKFLIFIDNY